MYLRADCLLMRLFLLSGLVAVFTGASHAQLVEQSEVTKDQSAFQSETFQFANVFSQAQGTTQSFLRFHNTGLSNETVEVTLWRPTGEKLATWESPVILGDSQVQYPLSRIEAETGIVNPPPVYTVTIDTDKEGYAQHVLYRPADGTLTNASTCGVQTTNNLTQIFGVHSGLLQNGFPSTVVVHNTAAAATSGLNLGIYDAETGTKLGTYAVPSIAAGAQSAIPVSTIESTLKLTPGPATYHYIVKAEGSFAGFLQNLVNNQQVGVITDMTTSCAHGLSADDVLIRNGMTEFRVGIAARSIAYGSDGNMWTTQEGAGKIGRITSQGVLTEFALPSAASAPSQIALGPDGNMWFTQRSARKIGRITPSGVLTEFATDVSAPDHIVLGPDGNMWFLPLVDASPTSKVIGRIGMDGTIAKFRISATPGVAIYSSLFVGPDGKLWVTRPNSTTVTRVTTAGEVTTAPLSATTPIAKGVTAPDGTLWFLPSSTSSVPLIKMSTSGTFTTYPFERAYNLAGNAILYGADNHIWISHSNGMITRTSVDGVTTYYQTLAAVNAAVGLASDGAGNVWFSATGASAIGFFNLNETSVRSSAGFSSAHAAGNSFLRFHNTDSSVATAVIAVSDADTGGVRGRWTSPAIAPNAQLQVDIGTIENALGIQAAPQSFHALTVSGAFKGGYQHVLYSPRDGTLTNLSTCDRNTSASTAALIGVHSSLLAQGFPSTVVAFNNSAATATAVLGIYDARSGAMLGQVSTSPLAPNAQEAFAVTQIEAALGITPDPALYHYVIKNENGFPGFLQHLVNNTQVGVLTDMTTTCGLK